MSDILGAGHANTSVDSLASGIEAVDADLSVAAVDAMFRARPQLQCVAVRPGQVDPIARESSAGDASLPSAASLPIDAVDGPAAGWGVLPRTRFQQLMTGRLGYGRLLHARKTAGALADWSPIIVDAATDIADVARLVLQHDGASTPGPQSISLGPELTPAYTPTASPLPASDGAVGVSQVLVSGAGRELRQVSVGRIFQALSAQLAVRALTDPLTGLANRDHFLQHLHRCCQQLGPQVRLAVVYIDLDGFKAFNDGYGHGVGDQVLQVVADRLRGSCRPQDLPARLGGDEFALIVQLPLDVRVDQAAHGLGERLLACLSGTITVGQLVLPGRASIGVAVADSFARSDQAGDDSADAPAAQSEGEVFAQADLLLREADLAMYQAKAAGGNRVQVVTGVSSRDHPVAPVADRRELQRAISAGEFMLHFQPITEVSTARLASVEALARWQHPDRGLLAPAAFLDAVADAGFAAELDRHIIKAALRQLAQWSQVFGAHAPPSINVNLSVQGLQAAGLADAVLADVRASGVLAGRLRLEIPETATAEHLQAAGPQLEQLRAAGVRLTLDDLGAGASTLANLTHLAVDGMKIDRLFVAGMLEDQRDAAVVRMLLELGLSTGLAVTAEGVETDGQLRLLQDMARGRAVYVQGYLRGRPVPAADLELPWPHDVAPCGSETHRTRDPHAFGLGGRKAGDVLEPR